MPVIALPPRGEWFPDARDGQHAMRVSWHAEQGFAVMPPATAEAGCA